VRHRWASALGRGLAGIGMLAITARSGPLRGALVSLEPALPALLLTLAILGALLGFRRRREAPSRYTERFLAGLLLRWGWVACILLFLAPLWSHWDNQPPGRLAAFSALLGRLPWSDAHGHFEGAGRLLALGELNGFSERRPLSATLLSVLLAMGEGRLAAGLTLRAVLLGWSAWLAARAIGLRYGLWSALAFLGIILALLRSFVPAVLTEPLAVVFGCLALTILLSGRARSSLGLVAIGLLAVDAALRARPGAQFLLAGLVVWGVLVLRRRLVTIATLVLVILLGGLHTHLINRFYGSGEASATSYFAYTLFGLTRNANYKRAETDFGRELAALPNEDARARFLYARSWERLRQDPRDFLRALAGNEWEFLTRLGLNLSLGVSPRPHLQPPEAGLPREPELWRDAPWGGVLLGLGLLGFARHLRRASHRERLFWLTSLFGVAASAPFVFGDTGVRALAAAFPLLALAFGAGLSARVGRRPLLAPVLKVENQGVLTAAALTAALLAVCLGGPAVVHAMAPRPAIEQVARARAEGAVVVLPTSCAAVAVTGRGRALDLAVPTLNRAQLRRLLGLGYFEDPADLSSLPTPVVLASCLDHASGVQRLIAAPPRLLRERGFVRLDLSPLAEGSRFAQALALTPLP